MSFSLGSRSQYELVGVHPTLVHMVEKALSFSAVDFAVTDGLRTLEEQKLLVERGASQTLNSKHLKQGDGYGHAVDLVPYINGRPRWELEVCYTIAEAVRKAAEEVGIRIRWGGCWTELTGTVDAPEDLVEAYGARRRAEGKKAFIDGPHYEILTP